MRLLKKKSIDSKTNDCNAIASFYGVSGKNQQHQYKDFLSNFKNWDQISHAKQWLVFPKNIGKRLSIDETSLSNGELYTILTNKAANGKKGAIVAMVAGTKANTVIEIIEKIPLKLRNQVTEITLDMAANMGLIAKKCFPNATQVTDRFTLLFYLNFGIRDTASLNSCAKISIRSFTRNQN